MRNILLFISVLLSTTLYGQVVQPQDLRLSIAPLVPIDLSTLNEEEQQDPLSTLSDTSTVNLRVIFDLPNTVNLDMVHFQVGSGESINNLLDIELPLNGELPIGYERQINGGFYIYDLGDFPYQGGHLVTVKLKDVSGNYSVPLTYPED